VDRPTAFSSARRYGDSGFPVSVRMVAPLLAAMLILAGGPDATYAADLGNPALDPGLNAPTGEDAPSWYVVGDIGEEPPLDETDDRLSVDALMSQRLEIDFNLGRGDRANVVTLSNGVGTDGAALGTYTMMLTGSYDVATGTPVTPRITAGVGMSTLDGTAGVGLPQQDPTNSRDVAPAFQFGVGADYAVSDNWDFTAEYRAFYQGAGERESGPVDPQVSQRFTIGAKIRF